MRAVLVAVLVASASAFMPSTRMSRASVSMMSGGAKPAAKKGPAKDTKKLAFVDAIKISDLPKPGNSVAVVVGGLDICLAVSTDGTVFAVGNKAPPTGTPLAGGTVSKTTIQDAQYGTEFSLATGAVVGKWLPGGIGFLLGLVLPPTPIPSYKLKKGGSTIQVEVDVNYKANYESGYWRGILDAQGKTDGGYY